MRNDSAESFHAEIIAETVGCNFKHMKKILTSSFLIALTTKLVGQVAIIKDEDGFTNVRAESQNSSEIIHRINLNEPFWFDEESYYSSKDTWIQVFVSKNSFTIDCDSELITGFVHRTRVCPLEQLEKYSGNDLSFEIHTKAFDEKDKIIDRTEDKWISKINGRKFWGTDGVIPKTEIKSLNIIVRGTKILVPEILTEDLFNCPENFTVFESGKSFIIHQACSDGARFFELVWVVNDKGIEKRLVGSII